MSWTWASHGTLSSFGTHVSDNASHHLRFVLNLRVRSTEEVWSAPGGKTEWSGDWADESPLWTAELKAELGFTAKNDGTFWMSLVDFANHFEVGLTICCCSPY